MLCFAVPDSHHLPALCTTAQHLFPVIDCKNSYTIFGER